MQKETKTAEQDITTKYGLIKAGAEYEQFDNGNIASFVIENDTLIYGYLFKAGTQIHLYPTGEFNGGILARTEITDVGGYSIEFAANSQLGFWMNETIASGEMAKNVGFGAPYELEIKAGLISFDTHGRLFTGYLASDFSMTNSTNPFGGYTVLLRANSRIQFHLDPAGLEVPSVQSGSLTGDIVWNEFEIQTNANIGFYPGESVSTPGSIHFFTSKYDTYRDGFLIKAGQIKLYENGNLLEFILQGEKFINNLTLPQGAKLVLFDTGKLKELVSPEVTVINSISYPPGTKIVFNASGDVVSP